MSDLQDINSGGNLTEIRLGGTLDENKVLTSQEIDTLIADNIANEAPRESTTYIPQDPAPEHAEGKVFFDDETQSLSVYNDVADFTLNLGQEGVTRVYNGTGVTITNGQVCSASGSTNDFPNAVLAQADTYEGSRVLGIATHDIPHASFGFVTNIGSLGFDDVTLIIDEIIYLSDTVPGGMTNTPPDFTTVLGTKLSDERILVNIENHKTLPTAIGWLYDISTVYDLDADGSFTKLINWNNSDGVFISQDPATGEIEVPYEGVYRLSLTFGATFTADGKDNRVFNVQLFDETDQTPLASFGFPMPSDTASITGTITAPFRVLNLHHLSLRIGVDLEDAEGVTFNNINFSVESIQIK